MPTGLAPFGVPRMGSVIYTASTRIRITLNRHLVPRPYVRSALRSHVSIVVLRLGKLPIIDSTTPALSYINAVQRLNSTNHNLISDSVSEICLASKMDNMVNGSETKSGVDVVMATSERMVGDMKTTRQLAEASPSSQLQKLFGVEDMVAVVTGGGTGS